MDDKSIRARLTRRDRELSELEYTIYRLMVTLDLVGKIEQLAICFDGIVLAWIKSFPTHSDVCGGTP